MFKLSQYYIFFVLFLFFNESRAQLCSGSKGVSILASSFGTGTPEFGGAFQGLSSGFQYVAAMPNAGQYTVVKNNFGMNNSEGQGWFQITDHTEETTDGYMLVINADETVRNILQVRHNTLCENTDYEFSIWFLNLLNYAGAKPNITFNVETPSGTVIKTFSTGSIKETASATWEQIGISFNSGSNTDLIIKMISNGEAGVGNDFALDDFSLKTCGPSIISKIDGGTSIKKNVCYGDNPTYVFSAELLAGFNDPVFQWEVSTGGIEETNWTNYTGLGAQSKSITISYTNANIGRYIYRLLVAERGKIDQPTCRVVSDMYTVTILKLPEVLSLSTSGSTCVGGEVTFITDIGSDVIDAYKWTGPNGFTSTLKNPVLSNLTTNDSGTYKVEVTNENGCTSSAQITISISPQIIGSTNITTASICANTTVALEAYGGTTYSWLPIEGLSDPSIANPIASPTQSTHYTVTISNGSCSVEKTIFVSVFKAAAADAGNDKNLLKGESITLNGSLTGDNVTKYYWTPSSYLDDPTKLNPIATPPTTITYTFHVESDCNTSEDEVEVTVFPNISIPNAFTPNGDGINDTWSIPAISTFKKPRLTVVNRYGRIVFESYDHTPWNGKSKGKEVPPGAYYYTLYINKDHKIYAGWVLVTR